MQIIQKKRKYNFRSLLVALAVTYFGANGWLLEFEQTRILVDPWLCGSLIFKPGKWLLKGELPREWAIPQNLNILLLTQGLPDHAHVETLKYLPKDLAVICSLNASKIAKKIGFKNIKTLKPGEKTFHADEGVVLF